MVLSGVEIGGGSVIGAERAVGVRLGTSPPGLWRVACRRAFREDPVIPLETPGGPA